MRRRNQAAAYRLPSGSGFIPGSMPMRLSPPGVVPPAKCPDEPLDPFGRPCDPAEVARQQERDELVLSLFEASYETIWYNQPSPIVEPPFRADVLDETFARVVIDAPAAPGDADASQGAVEIANAESAISGQAIPILTPADTSDLVTVISFDVPQGHALYVNSVGTWGHDFLASREVIQFRVVAAGRPIVQIRELGLQGSLDTPVRVHAILHENQRLEVQAVNRDEQSASLVEVLVFGWVFPVLRNDDTFRGLLDPQRGPKDQSRFAPGQRQGGCA